MNKQYQPKLLNQEELNETSKRLMELSRISDERSKKIKVMHHLRDDAEKFIEMESKDLRGEYSFYTVYENSNDEKVETYILIHAFYNEKDIPEKDVEKIMLEDIDLLNTRLKKTDLPIDYCFVMPYYDYINGGSCLFNNLGNSNLND